jgi:hypothetical protein
MASLWVVAKAYYISLSYKPLAAKDLILKLLCKGITCK